MFRTISGQPETARWRREDVDKLVGEPSNPKPKSSTAGGGAEPPLDIKMGQTTTVGKGPRGCQSELVLDPSPGEGTRTPDGLRLGIHGVASDESKESRCSRVARSQKTTQSHRLLPTPRLPTLPHGIPRNPRRIHTSRVPLFAYHGAHELCLLSATRPSRSIEHSSHRLRSPAHLQLSRLKSVATVRLWYSLRLWHHLAAPSACDTQQELRQLLQSYHQRHLRQINPQDLTRCQRISESHPCPWAPQSP